MTDNIQLPIEIIQLIENGMPLSHFLTPSNKLNQILLLDSLSHSKINHGLYAFWWTGNSEDLPETTVKIHTQQGEQVIQWLKRDFPKPCLSAKKFPLYIGKTSNFRNRISQHLCLGTDHWRKESRGRLYKKTTSCQFRSGIEHVFKYGGLKKNIDLFKNITLSFVPIRNDDNGAGIKERFYLEDMAIGYYRPWFNVDGER